MRTTIIIVVAMLLAVALVQAQQVAQDQELRVRLVQDQARVVRGPQGPQGLVGPAGPQGPVGPQGPTAEIPWFTLLLVGLTCAVFGGLVGAALMLGFHHPAYQQLPPVAQQPTVVVPPVYVINTAGPQPQQAPPVAGNQQG
ncbi:MAG: hypothetical protein PHE77_01280 [Candidatus Pacebacteria bacterium]|nr:hypothetical protein [Candidatus Paceibacterota bacterium]